MKKRLSDPGPVRDGSCLPRLRRPAGVVTKFCHGHLSFRPATYRLVHGIDLVARVAPSFTGFRHVGRLIQCASGAKFAAGPPSRTGLDEPLFADEFKGIFERNLGKIFGGTVLEPKGPGTFGPLFRFLPPEIRDHLQDSYWKALTP